MVPIAPSSRTMRSRKRASRGWRSAAMGEGELSGVCANDQETNLRIMIRRCVAGLLLMLLLVIVIDRQSRFLLMDYCGEHSTTQPLRRTLTSILSLARERKTRSGW